MYEDMEQHLIKAPTPLCTSMLVALIVDLFCHDPSKNVPFTQAKSLIRHVNLFLSYFNA
jgi:hypothetical protein